MTVASADVYTAVNSAWDARDLDDVFTAFWAAADVDNYPTLHDGMATPKQPMPYCVMEADATTITDRMSAAVGALREVRNVPIRFNIHSTSVDGDSRSAKEIASYLVEEVMKVFGGHATVSPEALTLSSGNHLWTEFVSDYGVTTEENTYNWIVNYIVKVDLPVKV